MMQIVIEIPREMYEQFKIIQVFPTDKIIANGTPLPEYHGRLIEDDKISLRDICFATELDHAKMIGRLNSAPTIIPATKEGDGE